MLARSLLRFCSAFRLGAGRNLPPPLGIAIDSLLQFKGDAAFSQSHVGQGSRQVQMPRVPFPVMADGTLEKVNGSIETSLAARHAPVERLNVAQRHVVVGLGQNSFGRLRDSHRLFPFALLEIK